MCVCVYVPVSFMAGNKERQELNLVQSDLFSVVGSNFMETHFKVYIIYGLSHKDEFCWVRNTAQDKDKGLGMTEVNTMPMGVHISLALR